MNDISALKNMLKKPVVLVGMMGTGKTHIGSALARTLGVKFYDSDRVIEKKAGCAVAEIFERDGEKKFRQSEHKTILDLLDKGVCIIATGGGAPVNPETLAAIKRGAISVWIDTPPQEIFRRLQGNTTRPLLQTDDPEKTLFELAEKRQEFYVQADIRLSSGNAPVQKTVQNLIKALSAAVNKANV